MIPASLLLFWPTVDVTQLVRPVSTTSAGSWTPVGAATLHEATNDSNLSTYMRSSAGTADDVAVLALGPLSTPVSGTVTVRIRHRAV